MALGVVMLSDGRGCSQEIRGQDRSDAMPDPKVVDSFLATVADTKNQPVFVHCGSANRVGGMWMVKRVLQDGWTIEKATEEAKLIGLRGEPLEKFALAYIESHKK